jgi:hypothetical protein
MSVLTVVIVLLSQVAALAWYRHRSFAVLRVQANVLRNQANALLDRATLAVGPPAGPELPRQAVVLDRAAGAVVFATPAARPSAGRQHSIAKQCNRRLGFIMTRRLPPSRVNMIGITSRPQSVNPSGILCDQRDMGHPR